MRNTVAILGIPVDDLNMDQALERVEEFIRSGRFHQVATANTDFLVKSLHDPELKTALLSSDLVVPDGIPLVLASRWLNAPLRERVTGADMVPRLAELAERKGYKVFMLGARPDVALRARDRLQEDYPGLRIVGCLSPPIAPIVQMNSDLILAQIEAAQPDILLVAFGNPKQEKWIHMHRDRLRTPVCIGVGGTFDFIAGTTRRAPAWVQRSGMEWLFRLLQEPRRLWRRYAKDLTQFARLILVQLWVMRRSGSRQASRIRDVKFGDWTIVSVIGALDGRSLPELRRVAERALAHPTHLILDLQATTHIDSAVLGTLLNLPRRAGYVGRELRLVGVQGRVRLALRAMHAEEMFRVYPSFADAMSSTTAEGLGIQVTGGESGVLLTLRGRATSGHVQLLQRALDDVPANANTVDLDLRGVRYVESGILAAVRRFTEDRERRGTFVRMVAGPAVKRVLAAERLAGLFNLTDAPRSVTPAEPTVT